MMLIPQAWSLGLELGFYVLAPFLVRRSLRWVLLAIAASVALRLAGARAGFVSDPWSYRFFPFELSMFLLGTLSYALYARVNRRPARVWEQGFGLSLIAIVLLYPAYRTADSTFFSASKLFLYSYLALALPFLYRTTRASRVDRLVGELSYPIYLSHMVVCTALLPLPVLAGRPNLFTVCVILSSGALSWLAVKLVDMPVNRFRQRRLLAQHSLRFGEQRPSIIVGQS
jgi:peptidoglycan/LPS O-acetylase OafA/YrhL